METACITHAHADHARPGHGTYYAAESCVPILQRRLGKVRIKGIPYGERVTIGDARVSFHPAGHCLGSAQVRVEATGEVTVAAGDYKRAHDPTCDPFEVVPCDTFITEATFALPVYRWEPGRTVAERIAAWWHDNREHGRVSVICAYSLGKAQRILGELARVLAPESPRVFVHGALVSMLEAYREQGIEMLPTWTISKSAKATKSANPFRGELVIAPPGAAASTWMRRFGPSKDVSVAFASGWMALRGVRRRRGFDQGFVLSDHADWPDLLRTIRETGASRVLCTHGSSAVLARHLRDTGLDADILETAYTGEDPEP